MELIHKIKAAQVQSNANGLSETAKVLSEWLTKEAAEAAKSTGPAREFA